MTAREQAIELMRQAYAHVSPLDGADDDALSLDALLSDEGRPLLYELLRPLLYELLDAGEVTEAVERSIDRAQVERLRERGVIVEVAPMNRGPKYEIHLPETEAT